MFKRVTSLYSLVIMAMLMVTTANIDESYTVTTGSHPVVAAVVEETTEEEILDFTPSFNEKNTVVLEKENKLIEHKAIDKKISFKLVSNTKIASYKKTIHKNIANNQLELNLSYKEIDSIKAIKLAKIKKVAWVQVFKPLDYEKTILAVNYNNKDRISTAQSAQEKSVPKINNVISKQESEELVFFDYSNSEDQITEESAKNAFTESTPKLKKAKEKTNLPIYGSAGVSTLAKVKANLIAKAIKSKRSVEAPRVDLGKATKSKPNGGFGFLGDDTKDDPVEELSACLSEKEYRKTVVTKSDLNIALYSVDYTTNDYPVLSNFELRFLDDKDEIYQDDGNGLINLQNSLNNTDISRRGILNKNGHKSIEMDIALSVGKHDLSIPMFTEDSYQKIIEDHKIHGVGGNLLVELAQDAEDAELEDKITYEAKLYLNKNFKAIDRSESDFNYIFFIGTSTGNMMLTYLDNKGKTTSKIIHLTDEAIYFESNRFKNIKSEVFSIFEENLLSDCKAIKGIDSKQIFPWSFEGLINKKGLNKFEIIGMLYPEGTRKYYEFKHLDESIYIGRTSNNNVIIPSESYINHILRQFDFINKDQCLVQLNLRKEIVELYVDAKSEAGDMYSEVMVLDSDGQFYTEPSGDTSKIYLMADKEGIFNVKIKYLDGSFDYLQSYCSESAYLIEQL